MTFSVSADSLKWTLKELQCLYRHIGHALHTVGFHFLETLLEENLKKEIVCF